MDHKPTDYGGLKGPETLVLLPTEGKRDLKPVDYQGSVSGTLNLLKTEGQSQEP